MSLWRWTDWVREQRLTLVCIVLCLAGVPLVLLNAWIIALLRDWHGFDEMRLALLGRIATHNNLLLFVVLLSLGMVLSIRAFKGKAGRDGAEFDLQGQDDDDAPAARAGASLREAAGNLNVAGAELEKGAST